MRISIVRVLLYLQHRVQDNVNHYVNSINYDILNIKSRKEGRHMLDRINIVLQRYIAVLTLLSLLGGVIFDGYLKQLIIIVPYIFAFMTFSGSIRMKFRDLHIFLEAKGTILYCMFILHVVMPAISYMIASTLFDDQLLVIGFVMLMTVPTGVTSLIWISIGRGDVALGIAVILLDTLLAPIIIPFVLHLVSGTTVEIDTISLIIGLMLMIVVPTIIAILLNELTHGKFPDWVGNRLSPFSKIALFLIVLINGSAIGPYVKDMDIELLKIIAVVFIIVVIGYIVAVGSSHFMQHSYARYVSMTFLGGMRNISTGVIVATTYFPPKVAMPVAFGMLFQQLFASIVSTQLEKRRPREN